MGAKLSKCLNSVATARKRRSGSVSSDSTSGSTSTDTNATSPPEAKKSRKNSGSRSSSSTSGSGTFRIIRKRRSSSIAVPVIAITSEPSPITGLAVRKSTKPKWIQECAATLRSLAKPESSLKTELKSREADQEDQQRPAPYGGFMVEQNDLSRGYGVSRSRGQSSKQSIDSGIVHDMYSSPVGGSAGGKHHLLPPLPHYPMPRQRATVMAHCANTKIRPI